MYSKGIFLWAPILDAYCFFIATSSSINIRSALQNLGTIPSTAANKSAISLLDYGKP